MYCQPNSYFGTAEALERFRREYRLLLEPIFVRKESRWILNLQRATSLSPRSACSSTLGCLLAIASRPRGIQKSIGIF
jgi:hypothetical protein